MRVVVTVGMSRWPFDRLVRAADGLHPMHDVFVQTGNASVSPTCPHCRFLPFSQLQERLQAADVVVTHGGNTVRLVQRLGKVPIAVARESSRGEMSNDHQVEFLQHEAGQGRVISVWNVEELSAAVESHPLREAEILRTRRAPNPLSSAEIAARLDGVLVALTQSPFRGHPLARYAYAWNALSMRSGRHLDIGCGTGEFLTTLAATSRLECHGVDPHAGYLGEMTQRAPDIPTTLISSDGRLPFDDASFDSVSLLDVLEHVADERVTLSEARRVLRPEGLVVVTVPRHHLFSLLDPDNAKFRLPRMHRLVYSLRFGCDTYRERFLDRENGLFGDMSVGRDQHTNYRDNHLRLLLEEAGFELRDSSRANLFWRLFQIPALLTGGSLQHALERAIALDASLFHRANLFVCAEARR
jgi:2-polyprenyl-3-methyl-5-hydroxy-6-metoxy-1,4-benzoquinol methylase